MVNRLYGPCEHIPYGWWIEEGTGRHLRHWPVNGDFNIPHGYDSCEWRQWDDHTGFSNPIFLPIPTELQSPPKGAMPPDFAARLAKDTE